MSRIERVTTIKEFHGIPTGSVGFVTSKHPDYEMVWVQFPAMGNAGAWISVEDLKVIA